MFSFSRRVLWFYCCVQKFSQYKVSKENKNLVILDICGEKNRQKNCKHTREVEFLD